MPAAPDEAPFSDEEIEQLFANIDAPADAGYGAIIAVSGGSDSLGLLLLLKRWRELPRSHGRPGPSLLVATVDHGLRPESAAEAREVAALCERWGFEHVTLCWTGEKPGTGIQEAAREARYALLAEEATRRLFGDVVTAHTRDDQAETVLMRLARGSGLKGLAGIRPRSSRHGICLHRPLLGVSRARLRAALEAAGVRWIEDPSNVDVRFLRPRLRALLPQLAEEGLDAPRLADIAGKLRRADEAIEQSVQRFLLRHAAVEYRKPVPGGRAICEVLTIGTELVAEDPRHVLTKDPRRIRPRADITWHVTIELEPYCLEPTEMGMRILARAIGFVAPLAGPIGDQQLERLAVEAARHVKGRLRRNLAGALISVGANTIRISPEPPRRLRRSA